MSDANSYLDSHPGFQLGLQITVGIICILSILGASLIILTYVLYKELRTTARLMLVNLSVADIMVAASHFAGLFYFKRYIPTSSDYVGADTDTLCSTQGAILMVGTIASCLWTLALALYLLIILVLRKRQVIEAIMILFYIVCWEIPLGIMIWFSAKEFYGFSEDYDIAWCYIREISVIYPEIVGYELWILITFIVLPVVNTVTFCGVKYKLRRIGDRPSAGLRGRVFRSDLKLVFVPTIFILLRLWSTIIDIVVLINHNNDKDYWPVLILLGGIGDSAQGLANAILFCVCTTTVRRRLHKTCKWWCRILSWRSHCKPSGVNMDQLEQAPKHVQRTQPESTTQLDESLDLRAPRQHVSVTLSLINTNSRETYNAVS